MSVPGAIPFVDLVSLHQEIEQELVPVFQQVLRTAGFIGGPMVEGFERDFAAFCSTEHCVGVASGTDALRFALIAAGVRTGDVVVTVPHTFIATTEAISQAGARPEFVDVDEQTHGMDVNKLREYLQSECAVDPIQASYFIANPKRQLRRSPSPYLRSNRRYGSNPRAGPAIPVDCHRRCVSGAWCRVFFENEATLDQGWIHGRCSSFQLSIRARTSALAERLVLLQRIMKNCAAYSNASRPRPIAEVSSCDRRIQRTA